MKYRDEDDKCYGIAGMAIGMAIWNGEDLIYLLDIDDDASGYIRFTSDFYANDPRLSTKESWESTLRHFQMSVGMLISNMLCRSLRGDKTGYAEIKSAIFDTIAEEGKNACQLESDEVESIFSEAYSYMSRAFSDSSIRRIATDFAAKLKESRTLSNSEVKELLDMLRH